MTLDRDSDESLLRGTSIRLGMEFPSPCQERHTASAAPFPIDEDRAEVSFEGTGLEGRWGRDGMNSMDDMDGMEVRDGMDGMEWDGRAINASATDGRLLASHLNLISAQQQRNEEGIRGGTRAGWAVNLQKPDLGDAVGGACR